MKVTYMIFPFLSNYFNPSILSAIAGAVAGSIVTGLFNRSTARDVQAVNIDAMKHRHQWEVEDLRKAGLNPILSAKLGGTSGMPGVLPAPMPDLGGTLSQGISSAMNIEQTRANVDKIAQEIKNLTVAEKLTDKQIYKVAKEISLLEEQWSVQHETHIGQGISNVREQLVNDYLASADFNRLAKDTRVPEGILKMLMFKFLGGKQ